MCHAPVCLNSLRPLFALFICLSHLLLHPSDLSLHFLCGSVRSETPCALSRMRSLALWSTLHLSQFSDRGKRRHISNSDLPRQQVSSNGSDVLRSERSPSRLHFVSCWFHQISYFFRIISKCDHGWSTKALQDAVINVCVGVEVDSARTT